MAPSCKARATTKPLPARCACSASAAATTNQGPHTGQVTATHPASRHTNVETIDATTRVQR